MKRIVKQIFIVTLLIIALITSMPMSAQAGASQYTAYTVTISTDSGWSRTYPAYHTKAEADANPITIEITKYDFPVDVVISATEDTKKTYQFKSYGIQNVEHISIPVFSISGYYAYATIDIEPYVYVPEQPSEKEIEAAAQEKIANDKLDQLLNELDLSFYDDKTTPYGKELKAFFAGEWDGSKREDTADNPYAGYIASRHIQNRKYTWIGTKLYTDKTVTKAVNVDYIGYLEVIPGPTYAQQFSFAVSRTNKTFEQWCCLDKVDSWKLPEAAETITGIHIVGKNSGDPDECQAIISTLDAENVLHNYSLLPGGKVKKLT